MMAANLGISILFPIRATLVASLMTGAFDSSAFMMSLITLLDQSGFKVMYSFIALAVLEFILTMLLVFVLLPSDFDQKLSGGSNDKTDDDDTKTIEMVRILLLLFCPFVTK